MKRIGDLMAATGKYTNKDGEEKTNWTKLGSLFEKDNGKMSIKLDSVPVGEFDGWVNVFEPREQKQAPEQAPGQPSAPASDEIPF